MKNTQIPRLILGYSDTHSLHCQGLCYNQYEPQPVSFSFPVSFPHFIFNLSFNAIH